MRTLFSLVLLIGVPASSATLVQQGKSAYSICLAAEASPSEQRGAQELQRFLAEMSGARLPVTNACQGRGPFLFVGDSAALRRVLPGFDAASFGPEVLLKTTGPHVAIAGGRLRGSMYGVYTFLERLGCRWFTPEVSRIPKQATLQLPAFDERQKPAFENRDTNITESEEKDWAARNKLNGHFAHLDASTGGKVSYFPFVHSFYDLISPQKYFAEHPEYFALVDGVRRADHAQLCLTHPEVLRLAVERVRQWIREHPDAVIFSVSQNDYHGYCECDRCRRVEQEEGGEHSGPLLRFVNAVAAEIEKTNPDKLIDTLAYQYTENPPAHVRPRPNVRIRLCPIGVCVSHSYEQCPRSAYFLKNLKAWARITNQLYIWHYDTNYSHYLAPFPDFYGLAANISVYQRNGVVGLFLEGAYPPGGGSENAELRSYVTARQMWNPAVEMNGVVDEFMSGVYGRAAKPMREYFDLLHREVRMPPEGAGQHLWIYTLLDYSPKFLPEANRLFSEALALADDAAVRRRVEKARLPVEYSELVLDRQYSLGESLYAPRDLPGWQTHFREFAAKLRGFGIGSIREARDLAEDEKLAAAARTYPVVYLENEFWKVAVVPELGGRISAYGGPTRSSPVPGARRTARERVSRLGAVSGRGWRTGLRPRGLSGVRMAGFVEGRFARASRGGAGRDMSQRSGARTPRARLDGEWIRTEVVARNATASPLQVVLELHAELDAGDIDAARVQFRKVQGAQRTSCCSLPPNCPRARDSRRRTFRTANGA